MAWIDLAANRFRLREHARAQVERWERTSEAPAYPYQPVLYALLGGDRELAGRAGQLAAGLLPLYQKMDTKRLTSVGTLRNYPNLLAAAELLGGQPDHAAWKRYAGAPPGKEKPFQPLQLLAAELAGGVPSRPAGQKLPPGSVATDKQWIRLVEKAPYAWLFDQATAVGHDLWQSVLLPYILPLALLLVRQRAEKGKPGDVFDLFRGGGEPERHPNVVFERRHPRPEYPDDGNLDGIAEPVGFDAVELVDGEVRVHHYVTLDWEAPLLFEPGLNAFFFLNHLARDWDEVRATVDASTWAEIERARNDGRELHVVVYDERVAAAPPDHLAAAARHYEVRLEARDFLSA